MPRFLVFWGPRPPDRNLGRVFIGTAVLTVVLLCFDARPPGTMVASTASDVVAGPRGTGSSRLSNAITGPATASSHKPLFLPRYDVASESTSATGWEAEQEPTVGGVGGRLGRDRIRVVSPTQTPGPPDAKPPHGSLRVELRAFESAPGAKNGDVTMTGGYLANRAEVFARTPAMLDGIPASEWPDPPDSIRWYEWRMFVPASFALTQDDKWLSVTQWKGLYGGQPPINIEIKRKNFRLGGSRTNTHQIPKDGDLGPVRRGAWNNFQVGVKWSTSAQVGWVEVRRDGVVSMPRTPVATLDLIHHRGEVMVDPTYLKQGIYRDIRWRVTHYLYFGPVSVTTG